MAIAAVDWCFSALTATGTSRFSLSSQRLFDTSHAHAAHQKERTPKKPPPPSSLLKSTKETEGISQKKFPGRSKYARPYSNAENNSGRSNTGRSQSMAFKSEHAEKRCEGIFVRLKRTAGGWCLTLLSTCIIFTSRLFSVSYTLNRNPRRNIFYSVTTIPPMSIYIHRLNTRIRHGGGPPSLHPLLPLS